MGVTSKGSRKMSSTKKFLSVIEASELVCLPREGGGPLAVEGARRAHENGYNDLFAYAFGLVNK